jgi:hypothetical protein
MEWVSLDVADPPPSVEDLVSDIRSTEGTTIVAHRTELDDAGIEDDAVMTPHPGAETFSWAPMIGTCSNEDECTTVVISAESDGDFGTAATSTAGSSASVELCCTPELAKTWSDADGKLTTSQPIAEDPMLGSGNNVGWRASLAWRRGPIFGWRVEKEKTCSSKTTSLRCKFSLLRDQDTCTLCEKYYIPRKHIVLNKNLWEL